MDNFAKMAVFGLKLSNSGAKDIGQTDDPQRPAHHRRRQATQIDLPRQVGDEEGDVEAAGEETQVQQQVAAVLHRVADRAHDAVVGLGVVNRLLHRPRQAADQRQRRQRHQRHAPHRAHPAHGLDQLLQDRREQELAEGAAGVDDARGRAARLGRHALRGGTDQHREAGRAGSHRRHQPDRHDQAQAGIHEGRDRAAQREQHERAHQHRAGAMAVGHCAGHWLDRAPGELRDRHGKADGGDAEAGGAVERADEEAHRLACAHRHQQDAGGGEGGDENVRAAK